MSNTDSNESKTEVVSTPDASTVSTAILHSILNDRQKRKLGLIPKREPTEKEKARLDALRERMRAMNAARKEEKIKKIPEVKVVPVQKSKKRAPPPSESSSEETESEERYVQKKAKKVNQTLKQLSKVEQHMQQLRQIHSTNPFYNMLRR